MKQKMKKRKEGMKREAREGEWVTLARVAQVFLLGRSPAHTTPTALLPSPSIPASSISRPPFALFVFSIAAPSLRFIFSLSSSLSDGSYFKHPFLESKHERNLIITCLLFISWFPVTVMKGSRDSLVALQLVSLHYSAQANQCQRQH